MESNTNYPGRSHVLSATTAFIGETGGQGSEKSGGVIGVPVGVVKRGPKPEFTGSRRHFGTLEGGSVA